MGTYKALVMTTEASNYITKSESMKKICKEVFEACEDFLVCYGSFLNDSERCRTMKWAWGFQFLEEYKMRFFTDVLMRSYNVFDKSHVRYVELWNAVKENNPEWLGLIIKDHEDKIRKCKVSVFPLEEALTA